MMAAATTSASKFIAVLYEMCSEPENQQGIGFSLDGGCLEIRDRNFLSQTVLPKYFKHNMIQSLVRQLNNYGFISRPPLRIEVSQCFTHTYFIKDRTDLLSKIKRKAALLKETNSNNQAAAAAAAAALPQQQQTSIDAEIDGYNALLLANQQLIQKNLQLQTRIKLLEDTLVAATSNSRFSTSNFVPMLPPPSQQQAQIDHLSYMAAVAAASSEQQHQQQQHLMNRTGSYLYLGGGNQMNHNGGGEIESAKRQATYLPSATEYLL